VYVFCKSWSGGDKRLLQAAILLFVAGILKFAQKPWALRAASFDNVMTSLGVYPQRRAQRTRYMFFTSGSGPLTYISSVDAVITER
jgi:hypothetical protein